MLHPIRWSIIKLVIFVFLGLIVIIRVGVFVLLAGGTDHSTDTFGTCVESLTANFFSKFTF